MDSWGTLPKSYGGLLSRASSSSIRHPTDFSDFRFAEPQFLPLCLSVATTLFPSPALCLAWEMVPRSRAGRLQGAPTAGEALFPWGSPPRTTSSPMPAQYRRRSMLCWGNRGSASGWDGAGLDLVSTSSCFPVVDEVCPVSSRLQALNLTPDPTLHGSLFPLIFNKPNTVEFCFF